MKTVYDTCLYIDLLRDGKRTDLFSDRSHIRYLSPLVTMELLAGARTPVQQRVVERLIRPYIRANRLITLHSRLYMQAGTALAKLKITKKTLRRGFSNDLLIALSTLSIGATLFTNNHDDFALISKVIPLKIEYV